MGFLLNHVLRSHYHFLAIFFSSFSSIFRYFPRIDHDGKFAKNFNSYILRLLVFFCCFEFSLSQWNLKMRSHQVGMMHISHRKETTSSSFMCFKNGLNSSFCECSLYNYRWSLKHLNAVIKQMWHVLSSHKAHHSTKVSAFFWIWIWYFEVYVLI